MMEDDPKEASASPTTNNNNEESETKKHVQYEGFQRNDPKEFQEIKRHVQYMGFRRVPNRRKAAEYTGKRTSAAGRLETGIHSERDEDDDDDEYDGITASERRDVLGSPITPMKTSKLGVMDLDETPPRMSPQKKHLGGALSLDPVEMSAPARARPSIKGDLRNFFKREDSRSQLSLSVNDSAANKTFDECYEKEDFLGEGAFAVVHRCRHKERGHVYAVKEIRNEAYEEEDGNDFKHEINTMKRLREIPYIVRLLDVFYAWDRTYIIMEEMIGGDLLDKITEKEFYPETECRRLARRLFEAIYYCHKKRIVHRDIKPENILLENKTDPTKIKLADFGCAKEISDDTVLITMCGTPQYVAPEIYMQRNGYDEKCDLWSAAVVVYLLLAGYVPFDGEPMEMHKIVCEGEYEFHEKFWSEITEPPKKLIRDLLKVDPVERATLVEILDTGWLKRLDREKAMQRRNSDSNMLKSKAFMNTSMRNFAETSAKDLKIIAE